jgi:hypothetical protein
MQITWPWTKRAPIERRSSGSGFTADIIAARASYIAGRTGLAEATAAAQSCVSLWEHGLSLSQVEGTSLLTRRTLVMIGRALALRGEAVGLISDDDRIAFAHDWDVRTRDGLPVAYRLSLPDAGGGRAVTALAGEVIHVAIGSDPGTPWAGASPLRRASLTAGLLHALESALSETFETAPFGSMIVPFPESPQTDNEALSRGFRGRRGSVLLRESVNVTAAGGPTPQVDWKPNDLSPDISRTQSVDHASAGRDGICSVFGVLPALLNPATTGPLVREAQRHLAQWTLQPICELIAEEAGDKLGTQIDIDCISPLQAFDQGGRARALETYINALAAAKAAGLTTADVTAALHFIDEGTPTDD